MNGEAFLKAFPDVKTNVGTGGNCTAWTLDLSPKVYVLITYHGGEPCQPSIVDRKAYFGIVNDGESVESRLLSFRDAAQWLTGVRDCFDAMNQWGA